MTGSARYSIDDGFSGSLYGAVVRSNCAHARVVAVDGSKALPGQGVLRIVTFDDLAGIDAEPRRYLAADGDFIAGDACQTSQ